MGMAIVHTNATLFVIAAAIKGRFRQTGAALLVNHLKKLYNYFRKRNYEHDN